jgi:hypothetical protein
MSAKAKQAQLLTGLIALQEQGSTAWSNVRRSNAAFYEHLAEVYFWWRAASEVKGFLDAKYAALNRKFKRVKYGTNYSPLLWLVWGSNNCSDSDADRHSRALNKIHAEYTSKPKYYAKDGVARMAAFIAKNNGVYGLIDYGKQTDEDDEEVVNTSGSSVRESQKKAVVYERAKSFYANRVGTTVAISNTLPVTDDAYGVILVKKTAQGYSLVGATNDAEIVQSLLVNNYSHEFSALPNATRCLVETIRSQVLPPKIIKMQRDLVDKSAQKNADKTNKLAVRRLLYRVAAKDFILSPVRIKSGVVTIATPTQSVMLHDDADVFLSTRARRQLEVKAVSGFEFNLYEADCTNTLRKNIKYDGATHITRMQNVADETDFFYLDFWQYENQEDVIVQVDLDENALAEISWQHQLGLDWFKQLTLDVLDKWFASHALYIKRPQGKLCFIEFGQDQLTLNLVYKADQFELRKHVVFQCNTERSVSAGAYFLTKDIMPVLRSIADYDITGEVTLQLYASMLVIKFSSAAASYVISVPTTNKNGIRSIEGFKSYEPSVAVTYETDEVFDYEQEAADILATAASKL